MSSEHENHGPNSNPLAPVEQTLAGFAPAPPQLDRDRLMFLAGQASAMASGGRQAPGADVPGDDRTGKRPPLRGGARLPTRQVQLSPRWLWPAATATFAATALALLVTLALRPAPQIVYLDRIITIPPMETMAQPTTNIARSDAPGGERVVRMSAPDALQGNYLRTRDVALRLGLDALGISRGADNQVSPALTNRELLEGLTSPAASSTRQSPDRTSSM
jgi:hypothetical protein